MGLVVLYSVHGKDFTVDPLAVTTFPETLNDARTGINFNRSSEIYHEA